MLTNQSTTFGIASTAYRSRPFLSVAALLLLSILGILIALSAMASRAVELPYDNTNSVIYDNDTTVDVYTDDYLMALASAGDINLAGMITTASVAPFNKYVSPERYEQEVADRLQGVAHARNSGFRNIPEPVRGVKGHLRRPSSGKIEDTEPIGSEGSRLIVNEAKKAKSGTPVVIVVGGPLTTVADAYLLDNVIADNVIVAWLANGEGMSGYNGWADPWAGYIVLKKLRLVQFPAGSLKPAWQDYMVMFLHKLRLIKFSADATPYVPKSRLATLPDTPLREWMIDKKHYVSDMPGDMDADAPPAISLMRGDYVLRLQGISFSHWGAKDGHRVPFYREDPHSNAAIVEMARKDLATKEWWRALKNPAAYGRESR